VVHSTTNSVALPLSSLGNVGAAADDESFVEMKAGGHVLGCVPIHQSSSVLPFLPAASLHGDSSAVDYDAASDAPDLDPLDLEGADPSMIDVVVDLHRDASGKNFHV